MPPLQHHGYVLGYEVLTLVFLLSTDVVALAGSSADSHLPSAIKDITDRKWKILLGVHSSYRRQPVGVTAYRPGPML